MFVYIHIYAGSVYMYVLLPRGMARRTRGSQDLSFIQRVPVWDLKARGPPGWEGE